MSRNAKTIVTFVISFVIAFFIVSYIRNSLFISIKWAEDATLLDRFREYYIRPFGYNFMPTLLIAVVSTTLIKIIMKRRWSC